MSQPFPFRPITPPWQQAAPAPVQPPWVTAIVPAAKPIEANAAEVKARIHAEFEMVFPRILAKVYGGMTATTAIKELPISIDYGAFNRWVRKDSNRRAMMEEAEEARAEVWADRMIEIATGIADENGEVSTLERDKFKVDVYKHLMGRQSRKRYGETKTNDHNVTISIAAALAESSQRVIEATVITDDSLPDDEDDLRLLVSGDADDD